MNRLTAVAALLLASLAHVAHASEFGTHYEEAKPKPGGITPQTRKEFLDCMIAWLAIGGMVRDAPELMLAEHSDFTPKNASQMLQHWGKKAKTAYGAERAAAYTRDYRELAAKLKSGEGKQATFDNMIRTFSTAGLCYVPPGKRTLLNSSWSISQSYDYARNVKPSN